MKFLGMDRILSSFLGNKPTTPEGRRKANIVTASASGDSFSKEKRAKRKENKRRRKQKQRQR